MQDVRPSTFELSKIGPNSHRGPYDEKYEDEEKHEKEKSVGFALSGDSW